MAPTETRPETIIAALLYLVTAYHRRPCPGLAACIARHFECLGRHPKADRLLSDVALASISEWQSAAQSASTTSSSACVAGQALH
jgi:hypothetical protein